MKYEIIPLTVDLLDQILMDNGIQIKEVDPHTIYFTPGSIARCLCVDSHPVFAGGIANMQWGRGEAWIIPTKFMKRNYLSCFKAMRNELDSMAKDGGFHRVQAVCISSIGAPLIMHLGMEYEGTMRKAGPNEETCYLYARLYD